MHSLFMLVKKHVFVKSLMDFQGDQTSQLKKKSATKAEALILWSPDVKNWLIGKDPDAGKD